MLKIDFANCLSDRVAEHGLDPASIAPGSGAAAACAEITADLAKSKGTGWERWRLLPHNPLRSEHTKAIRDALQRCDGRFDTCIVLGIGGSALGNIALQAALNPPTWNLLENDQRKGPRLFVVDNVDPAHLGAILRFAQDTDPGLTRTLFNVISKSGETAETAAQFMTIRKLLIENLGERDHADHIIAITDPAKGTMRSICNKNGYTTLPVPDGVGGRFSVLSPVGLFSAALCAIDIEALLDGAAEMSDRCESPDLHQNPAAMLATLLVHLGGSPNHPGPAGGCKPNHVLMPYSNALYLLADWFRQLWAESLGKRVNTKGEEVFAGYTPIKALGTTDQHSQVQLYREGPNDKVFGFLEVEDFGTDDLKIPTGLGVEALTYLEGKQFSTLLNAEKRATEYALIDSRRPNFTIKFPRIDARSVGEFIALWQMTTAYAGRMLNIDAYDQPAVETGKVATFGLMGRNGYEEWRSRVAESLRETPHII